MQAIASEKKGTAAQLSLAWVCSTGPHVVPIPGSSKVERIEENFDSLNVQLTEEEVRKVNGLASQFKGPKGFNEHTKYLWG